MKCSQFKKSLQVLEDYVEELEECIDVFSGVYLNALEDLASTLLLCSSVRSNELPLEQAFRRRVRYASAYISNIVRKKKLYEELYKNQVIQQSNLLNLVSAKVQVSEQSEWIPALEREQNIILLRGLLIVGRTVRILHNSLNI